MEVLPIVNVKLIEGVFDADQKRQIVERLRDADGRDLG
jgi:phenylpyruvate tautomerase PptA (4-oxalocrotonate tautomerase family)